MLLKVPSFIVVGGVVGVFVLVVVRYFGLLRCVGLRKNTQKKFDKTKKGGRKQRTTRQRGGWDEAPPHTIERNKLQ